MGAISNQDFPAEVALGDWSIQNLSPTSGLVQLPVAGVISGGTPGTNNYAWVTGSVAGDPPVLPNNSTALSSGLAAEVTRIEITSPVVANSGAAGVTLYPDLQVGFMPDGNTSLTQYQWIDGSYGTNMMPPQANTVGEFFAILGYSLQEIATALLGGRTWIRGNKGYPIDITSNLPLLLTGIKYTNALQLIVQSTRGWGAGVAGDTVITKARLRVWGRLYNAAMIDLFASAWNGSFSKNGIRRTLEGDPVIAGTHLWSPSFATWSQGPGGYNQKGPTIHREYQFAQNLVATSPSTNLVLSNQQGAGGNTGNVNTQNDLGFPFGPVQGNPANATTAVVLDQYGVAGGVTNIAFTGLQIGGQSVPAAQGYPLSTNVSDIQHGQVGPQRSGGALFYVLPDIRYEAEIFAENAGVFVRDNGTAIPAYTAPTSTANANGAANVAVGGWNFTNLSQ